MAYASLQFVDTGCTGTAASRAFVLAQCLAACDSIVFGGWRVSICMLVCWTWIVSIEHPWMPSSFCRQPVRHVSRIYIFCVIRQYVWQIVCDFSMLWWRQFRFSELGTGQPINMICKPWIVRFKNIQKLLRKMIRPPASVGWTRLWKEILCFWYKNKKQ